MVIHSLFLEMLFQSQDTGLPGPRRFRDRVNASLTVERARLTLLAHLLIEGSNFLLSPSLLTFTAPLKNNNQ
jgi:membrane glycosyltransferase